MQQKIITKYRAVWGNSWNKESTGKYERRPQPRSQGGEDGKKSRTCAGFSGKGVKNRNGEKQKRS